MKPAKLHLFFWFTFASILTLFAQKLLRLAQYTQHNPNPSTLVQAEELMLPKDMRLKIISPSQANNLPFILLLSGDGGWTKFDQLLAESLANEGFSIIGLDSKVYFWNRKTPNSTTMELSKVIQYYQSQWNKDGFMLMGYSFGADIIPFIANRLNPSLKKTLCGVLALSPDQYSDFEVHLATLLNLKKSTRYDVLSEFKNLNMTTPVIFFGSKEDIKLRNLYIKQDLRTIILTGNHHFNFDYPVILKGLINAMPRKQPPHDLADR